MISDEEYRANLAKLAGQTVPRAVEWSAEVWETADKASESIHDQD